MVANDCLIPVTITSVGGRRLAEWAEGLQFRVPRTIIERNGWRIEGDRRLAIPPGSSPLSSTEASDVREHAAFTDRPPASSRLPISYQWVPGWARAAAASMIGGWNRRRVDRWAAFPGWPIDLSADLLADLSDGTSWQSAAGTPVVLTHDIDSPEGLRSLVAEFLPREERVGARSTSYVVPCSWPIDHGLLGEVTARGHEVGVHGYDHSNLTPFAATDERRRRLDAARPFADRYGARGYRAPSLLRTRALLSDLRSRYDYDSSIPTSGGLFPVPNNGCATARPFVLEGIVELPLTLPRDGSLRFLGYSPLEIAESWIECSEIVARAGGVVVLLTHCERRFSGNVPMLDAYCRFLEHLQARRERFRFDGAARVARLTRSLMASRDADAMSAQSGLRS